MDGVSTSRSLSSHSDHSPAETIYSSPSPPPSQTIVEEEVDELSEDKFSFFLRHGSTPPTDDVPLAEEVENCKLGKLLEPQAKTLLMRSLQRYRSFRVRGKWEAMLVSSLISYETTRKPTLVISTLFADRRDFCTRMESFIQAHVPGSKSTPRKGSDQPNKDMANSGLPSSPGAPGTSILGLPPTSIIDSEVAPKRSTKTLELDVNVGVDEDVERLYMDMRLDPLSVILDEGIEDGKSAGSDFMQGETPLLLSALSRSSADFRAC